MSCREHERVRRTFHWMLLASVPKASARSAQRSRPTACATPGKLYAQLYATSESAAVGLEGFASCVNCSRSALEMASAGSVAIKGPSAWHAEMRTQRDESTWNSCISFSSCPVRTSRGITADTSARLSTLALRTPQISSRASTSKMGSSRPTVSSGPTTVDTAPTRSAAALRTRKAGSSARHTSSGSTYWQHRS